MLRLVTFNVTLLSNNRQAMRLVIYNKYQICNAVFFADLSENSFKLF